MENKVYRKANVKIERTSFVKILMVIALISIPFCIMWIIPVRYEQGDYALRLGFEYNVYNMFGAYMGHFYTTLRHDVHLDIFETYWNVEHFFVPVCIWLILFVPLMYISMIHSMAKKCTLELNQDGILGQKKKLFTKESLNMPFEKIDSVYLKNGIIDKILGGQTIVINTASSKVKFLCIDNAQEFVDKTLEELKRYKESVSSNKEKALEASDENAMDAILKLKNLLDQGLITPEEFEEKRKSFINRI